MRPLSVQALLIVAWLSLLAAAVVIALPRSPTTLADDLTRYTVRVALLYYAIAANLMLLARPTDWQAGAANSRLARLCWTLAYAAYIVHLFVAFHLYHRWSHADAMAHTEEVSGFGPGIFVSHSFTLLWTGDVIWWWLGPNSYARRSPWIDRLWHGFMAFMVFNATVVYETGLIRWAGLLMFAELLAVGAYRHLFLRRDRVADQSDTPRISRFAS